MAIFTKKVDSEQRPSPESGAVLPVTDLPHGYGIEQTIQLLRSLPADQNANLVIRVVRATLASLNVRLSDIVGDGTRKQQTIEKHIATVRSKIVELEGQLETQRQELAALDADLKETIGVKEQLQQADKLAELKISPSLPGGTGSQVLATTLLGHLPPKPIGSKSD
jgi:hypothetical protein